MALKFSIALICVGLAACSTTQRSSSATGEQAPASISESATAPKAAAPADNQAKSSEGATVVTGRPSPKAGDTSPPETFPPSAVSSSDADEEQMKRKLSDQDAEINRLRSAQQAEAAQINQKAQESPQTAAANEKPAESEAPPAAAAAGTSAAAANKRDEEAAVFPERNKTAEAGASRAAAESSAENLAAPPGAMERSVYFGYDETAIPAKYDSVVLANAAYLKANPDAKAEIQGNCDERGSREYNLALGARRARAVKRALELAGADGKRIHTVSFGAEKPIAMGKDEESYSKNRRADIVY
jgi:peptidoglycan-associated lipoprotein